MISVPFLDLQATYLEIKEEIDHAILSVMQSGWYLLGKELKAFEEEFAHYVNAKHCVGVGNGLDALHLSLLALNIKPGDEVIVPSHTYIATWLAVTHIGAIPVPVEPDERTYNIDPKKIESAITEKTKVILPVHLYGQPADLDPILQIAKTYNLFVLDDAAQAHGSSYKGKKVGNLCDLTAWSFYPGKNLGAFGDGGAITTDDDQLAETLRSLRNYGSRIKYINEKPGFNTRLDEIQAAALRIKLKYLDKWNQRRRDMANWYYHLLQDSSLTLPFVPDWADPVWHLYVVRSQQRHELQQLLKDQGVNTIIHYPIPPYKQAAYADLAVNPDSLILSQQMADEVLSLPIGPHFSLQQQNQIHEAFSNCASFLQVT